LGLGVENQEIDREDEPIMQQANNIMIVQQDEEELK